MTEKGTPDRGFNVIYTGEKTPPPPSPHPNIQMYRLPPPLTESLGAYLADHPLEERSTDEKVAVALALDKCAKLTDLPFTLQRLGLEEVTFEPSAALARTCAGYTEDLIPRVILALFGSAQKGDIPAMLALIHLLDPGGPGIRVRIENQEQAFAVSADDLYAEVHGLAYHSIPDGNLYYAKNVVGHLLTRGTTGMPEIASDGSFRNQPHRPSLIKAIAHKEALWAIGADPGRSARGMGLLGRLADDEKVDMQAQSEALIAGWLRQPVLFDSDIKAQGYWRPDLY